MDRRVTERVGTAIVSVARVLSGFLIFASLGLNLVNVFCRYVLAAPIIWTEELMIYILVWCVFLGAVLATWEGGHLKVDIFSMLLPPPWKQIINGVGALLFLAVAVFVVPQSVVAMLVMQETNARSMTGQFPLLIPHAALLAGFVLMPVLLVLRARAYISGHFPPSMVGGMDEDDTEGAAKVVSGRAL